MLSKLQGLGLLKLPFQFQVQYGFATKMQAGSTAKTKDSAGRRLGVKKFGNEEVFPDDILIRQRGFKWKPGQNTYYGKDHTIHSKIEGVVYFQRLKYSQKKKFSVNIIPRENPNRTHMPPPPYCYHPELFPELALKNPTPIPLPLKLVHQAQEVTKKPAYYNILKNSKYTKAILIPQTYYDQLPGSQLKIQEQEIISK